MATAVAPEKVAPATPATPAPAAAPAPKKALTMDEAMDMTINATMEQAKATEAATPTLPGRDPVTGKFVPKDATTANTPTATGGGEAQAAPVAPAVDGSTPVADGAPAVEEPVVIPEGFVAVEALPAEKSNFFKVLDKDGEVEAPDLVWRVPLGNGVVRDLSTDKLVSYAQMGVYNHEREQKSQLIQRELQQSRGELETFKTRATNAEAKYESLMQSDEAYIAERQRYDLANTPAERLKREQEARLRAEEQVQLVTLLSEGQQYFQGQIVPAFETIHKALPTVTTEEVGAHLLLLTEHYRVNTSAGLVFPKRAYEAIQAALIQDVVPWAKQLHESRVLAQAKPTKDAEAKVQQAAKEKEAAQIRAQKARKTVSAATRPVAGQQPSGTPARPQPNQFRTQKDAEEAVVSLSLASMRAG